MENNKKYWQLELPKIKILGKVRIAHYEKAGVLQLNLLHQGNDGSITIGKTICLYKDSICRENLNSLDFLMDVLHMWRKQTRAGDTATKHYNTKENIVLPYTESLDNVSVVKQGDFTYDVGAAEAVGVDTLTVKVVNTDTKAMSVDTSGADVGQSKNNEVSI